MLFALGSPAALLVLVGSFVVAATAHGLVQAWVAVRSGQPRRAPARRTRPDPRRHLDPFGTVAAAISGLGWARQPGDDRVIRRLPIVLLSGGAANLLLGVVALLAAARLTSGVLVSSLADLQSGVPNAMSWAGLLSIFGLTNLAMGALSLVPLPPLPAGRLLFLIAPRSAGWQRAEYHLVEQNIGTAVLLALLLIPLGGPRPVLPVILDAVVAPVLRLLAGG